MRNVTDCDSVAKEVATIIRSSVPLHDVTETGHNLHPHSASGEFDLFHHSYHPELTSPAAIVPTSVSDIVVTLPAPLPEVSSSSEGEFVPDNDIIFFTPTCASVEPVPIYTSCISGACECVSVIGTTASQLKPCRAAQFLFGPSALVDVPESERDFLWSGLNNGFAIVDSDCPSTYSCDNYDSILETSTHKEMCELLQREVDEGKVSIVTTQPRCVHSLGAVRKSNGSLRPITDCSRPESSSINNYMSSTFHSFTYNSVQDAVSVLSQGDFMAVVDISSAYRAVNVKGDHATFQGLSWDFGQGPVFLQDNRLCFCLKCAPNIFDSLSRFIVAVAKARGASRVINYLDDFLVLGHDTDSCLRARDIVTSVIELLGFKVSWKKVTNPDPVTTFLGIQIDSVKMELSLPLEKVIKLRDLVTLVLERGRTSRKELECLGGLVSYCSYVVRGGRTFSRRIFDLAASYSRASRNIPLSEAIMDDLKWWLSFCGIFNGRACIIQDLHPLPMYSDSSFKGFGAWLGKDYLLGFWDHDDVCPEALAGCSHLAPAPEIPVAKNINVYELWPLVAGLKRWGHFFKNSRLHFITDNMQVLAMINTGRSANRTCMSWLREMFWMCFILNIDIFASYISSADNVLADALSRVPYTGMASKCQSLLDSNNMCCSSSSRSIVGPATDTPALSPGLITSGLDQEVAPLSDRLL